VKNPGSQVSEAKPSTGEGSSSADSSAVADDVRLELRLLRSNRAPLEDSSAADDAVGARRHPPPYPTTRCAVAPRTAPAAFRARAGPSRYRSCNITLVLGESCGQLWVVQPKRATPPAAVADFLRKHVQQG